MYTRERRTYSPRPGFGQSEGFFSRILFTTQSIQGRIYRLFWIKAVRILLRCQVWRAFAPLWLHQDSTMVSRKAYSFNFIFAFSFLIIYSLSTLPTLLLFPPGTSKMFNFRHHSVGDLPEVHSKLPFPSPNLFVFFIRKVAPVILTFIVNTLNYHQINICSLTI